MHNGWVFCSSFIKRTSFGFQIHLLANINLKETPELVEMVNDTEVCTILLLICHWYFSRYRLVLFDVLTGDRGATKSSSGQGLAQMDELPLEESRFYKSCLELFI
jgi:hypothetical protein